MDTIWSLDWRAYPAAILTALGLVLAGRGGLLMVRGFLSPYARPSKNLRTVRAMRALLQGLSLAAIALGWWLHWPAMFWAGVLVGFEETLETSIVTWALRQEYELDASGRPSEARP
ncbi:MAG: hypothetical protein WD557_18530 [Dehalococcoidia bacterium]